MGGSAEAVRGGVRSQAHRRHAGPPTRRRRDRPRHQRYRYRSLKQTRRVRSLITRPIAPPIMLKSPRRGQQRRRTPGPDRQSAAPSIPTDGTPPARPPAGSIVGGFRPPALGTSRSAKLRQRSALIAQPSTERWLERRRWCPIPPKADRSLCRQEAPLKAGAFSLPSSVISRAPTGRALKPAPPPLPPARTRSPGSRPFRRPPLSRSSHGLSESQSVRRR